jgi:acyl carrier protein
MSRVLEKLKKMIAEQLGVDEESIMPSASFVDDLNIDPPDLAELITAVEQGFSKPGRKLDISDEDTEKIVTVQDLVDCLHDYGIED